MIYVTFKSDSKFKKIISSSKKYSLQEASSILEKLEEHSKNSQSIESVEYSILENQDLLFRDSYITQSGNQTDIILLIKEILDTVFRDYPQGEKDLLISKLENSINESICVNDEYKQCQIESEHKQEEEDRREQLKEELKQEEKYRKEQLKEEFKQEEEKINQYLESELKQEEEKINQYLKSKLKQEEEKINQYLESKIKQEEETINQYLEEKLKQEEEDRRKQLEEKLKQEEEDRKKQLEIKLKQEEEDRRKQLKLKLNKELKKDELLKKYIKTNERLKKSKYKNYNNGISIAKVFFMVCCIIIGLSLYKNLLKL